MDVLVDCCPYPLIEALNMSFSKAVPLEEIEIDLVRIYSAASGSVLHDSLKDFSPVSCCSPFTSAIKNTHGYHVIVFNPHRMQTVET